MTCNAHYWIITPPEGEFGTGTCKLCGATKQFRNSFSYANDKGYVPDSLTKKRTKVKTGGRKKGYSASSEGRVNGQTK